MRPLRTLLAAGLALLALCMFAPGAWADPPPTITVMTRNLYFGTDLTPVVQATTFPAFVGAVANAYNEAQASDFAGRAAAWADEIILARPDLVALQEAVQWRTGPADFTPTPDAEADAGDFLNLLLAALAARGQHYSVAARSTGYDVEAPGLFASGYRDIRLTQHEVILARTDAGLQLANGQSGQYSAKIALPSVVGPIPLPWSWASVDVTKGGRSFRFATTHLDPNSASAQLAQAQEFLTGPGNTTLPLVWAGDFNSDADATSVTGVVPATETYGNLVGAGLHDSWAASQPLSPGYTCCEAEDLLNAQPTLSERIDLILTRGPFDVLATTLVGDTSFERQLFGRWPSDHAGVVAVLRLGAR